MSISENIAKYRKAKGYTQEQLGEMLGVTNQAVSKWESAASMPDILLLPGLAEALGITLEELYGSAKQRKEEKDRSSRIDGFSVSVQNQIKTYLYEQLFADAQAIKDIVKIESGEENITDIKSACTIGVLPCISGGAAFISDTLSVVASDFDIRNGGRVFADREIASGMKKLCDPHVRKVLGYMYAEAFKDVPDALSTLYLFEREHDLFYHEYMLDGIASACGLAEEDALEAIEKLISLHIVEVSQKDGDTPYTFVKTKGIETAVVLYAFERLMRESMGWGCGYIAGHMAE